MFGLRTVHTWCVSDTFWLLLFIIFLSKRLGRPFGGGGKKVEGKLCIIMGTVKNHDLQRMFLIHP